MNLKDLIDFLAARDPGHRPAIGFAKPHSYRGDYAQVAFEPARDVTIGDMLEAARTAHGETFTGYKGGDFTMGDWTDCYLANYGCCGEEIGPVLLGYMCGEHAA